jgi:hypothetical protein
VVNRVLLASGEGKHLAELADVATLVRRQGEAELSGVGDGVEHAAPGDVGLYGADHRDLDRHARWAANAGTLRKVIEVALRFSTVAVRDLIAVAHLALRTAAQRADQELPRAAKDPD